MNLIKELKRRNVFRMAGLYVDPHFERVCGASQ